MHFVYILKSLSEDIYYKGYTTDYLKRLAQHNSNDSRYTSNHGPWELVYAEKCKDKRSALIRERQLKRGNRKYIEWLIKQPSNILNKNKIE